VGFSIDLSDRFLDLVYDAATEPDLWSSVLTEISDLTGSQGGVLFGQSTRKVFFDYMAGSMRIASGSTRRSM
jgi:hypothetical protein